MTKNTLTKIIEDHQSTIQDDVRDYIGASSIGSDCLRQIWYKYKGVSEEAVPAKTRRTWAIGKRLEGLVIEWLMDCGVLIDLDPQTYRARNVPIFQGHFDGIIFLGKLKAILEVKTAKDASFKIFVKKGLKVWNPQYYAQVQSYMGMSGINSTYILVLNKDNSDLSDELVTFDAEFYEKLEQKAQMISNAVVEPPRVHGSPLWYQCKMCNFNKVCHK
jgi:hypothetical protein